MTVNSTSDSASIFKDGKLKSGIYKIQNIYAETFLDIEVHSREVCCRPANNLGEGRGLWEIKQFGSGYTVQRFDPGTPEQFCTPLNGLHDGVSLRVAPYPTAWRVEIVDNEEHHGFEYVRFYWPNKKIAWDLAGGRKDNGSKVQTHSDLVYAWQIWRLIPMRVEGISTPLQLLSETLGSSCLPSYDGESTGGQSSTRAQQVESERDDFGTVVTEITIVTTRNKYRVGDT